MPRQHRPRLAISCPRTVTTGEAFEVSVRVETRGPLEVTSIDLYVEGTEQSSQYFGNSRFYLDHQQLSGATRLASGSTRFHRELVIPMGNRPSRWRSGDIVGYRVRAQVSVPGRRLLFWSFEAEDSVSLGVEGGSAARIRRKDDPIDADWLEAARRYGHRADGSGIHGQIGDIELTVRREHQGPAGNHLIAELHYPCLQLGLAIDYLRGQQAPGSTDLQLGLPAWDRRHRVRGREPVQASSFLAGLSSLLSRYAVDMNDNELRITDAGPGIGLASLVSMVGSASRLAERIAELRALIPAPAAFAGAIADWRALAELLEGTLDPVVMTVRGSCNGLPATISHDLASGGRPVATTLTVAPEGTIGEAYRFEAAAPVDAAGTGELDAGSRELVRLLARDASRVAITPDAVTVELPPQVDDTAGLHQRLRQMTELVRQLAPGAGPYR